MVAGSVETQVHAVVRQAFAIQTVSQTGLAHQIHGPLLEHAGADPSFDVLAALIFNDDRIDTGEVQEMRQHQPRGACANDSDLCPQFLHKNFQKLTSKIDSCISSLVSTNV